MIYLHINNYNNNENNIIYLHIEIYILMTYKKKIYSN